MSFLKLVIYFAVFSFIGWVSETIICSYNAKKFVKRGFLTGPFLPVYGFGGLIIVILLAPLKGSPFLLYVVGVVLVTILEYITALLLENIFQLKLWDYSDHKFNYKGRVWIVSSLFFGVLGLFGVYVLNPPFTRLVERLSPRAVKIIGIILLVYFVSDTVNSVVTFASIRSKLSELNQFLEEQWEETKEQLEIARQQRQWEKAHKTNWSQRRLLDAYPNMKSKKHKEPLPYLRDIVADMREKNRQRKLKKKRILKKRKDRLKQRKEARKS